MFSTVHLTQTPPVEPGTIAPTPQAPVAPHAMVAAGRVRRARMGAPGFAVGAAALLFLVLAAFMLFAVLLVLMS